MHFVLYVHTGILEYSWVEADHLHCKGHPQYLSSEHLYIGCEWVRFCKKGLGSQFYIIALQSTD